MKKKEEYSVQVLTSKVEISRTEYHQTPTAICV